MKRPQVFAVSLLCFALGMVDWFSIGRVYVEADEWDKAQAAFDDSVRWPPASP